MKQFIIISSIILLYLFGCQKTVFQKTIQNKTSINHITTMTFNIRHANFIAGWTNNSRKEEIISILMAYSPDIICLQETYDFQYKDIKKELLKYDSYGVGRNDGKEDGEYCPIFFQKERFTLLNAGTFWFSNTPEVPGSKVLIDIVPRICTWVQLKDSYTNKELFVYNLHITPISQSSREKNISLLKNRLKYPCIIAGDFNMKIDNKAMIPLGSMKKVRLTSNQIDHIIYSQDMTLVEACIDMYDPYPSDHYALIAILKWADVE